MCIRDRRGAGLRQIGIRMAAVHDQARLQRNEPGPDPYRTGMLRLALRRLLHRQPRQQDVGGRLRVGVRRIGAPAGTGDSGARPNTSRRPAPQPYDSAVLR